MKFDKFSFKNKKTYLDFKVLLKCSIVYSKLVVFAKPTYLLF